MDIKGQCLVFVSEVGKAKAKIFSTTISRKEGEEYKDNKSVQLNFAQKILPDEKKAAFSAQKAYKMEIEGFLTTRGYSTKDGDYKIDIIIQVTKAKCLDGGVLVNRPAKKEKPTEDIILGEDGQPLPF